MQIARNGTQPVNDGPAAWFTGAVHVQMLFAADEPGRVSGGSVTFEPRARTAWHTHPLGQTLVVTGGTGRVQRWGGPVEVISGGDVVTFAPGEKHWHGAAPDMSLTHLAIQEQLDGSAAEWMEKVTEDQYAGEVAPVAGAAE